MEPYTSIGEVLAAYVAGPEMLDAALAGLTDDGFGQRIAPGEWSVREIVQHLIEGDLMWGECLKVAIVQPGFSWPLDWYTGNDPFASALRYDARALGPTLALFRAHHAYIAEMLRQLPDVWDHPLTVSWPWIAEAHTFTVAAIVAMQARHVVRHCAEIAAIRARYGG